MTMHADERGVDVPLVRRLLAAQFPEGAELPLSRVASDGTDNAIYRLGNELAVRLPRHPGAAESVEKEAEWVPRLAPLLPLDVPLPVALGRPGDGYPWLWTVCRWLPGERASMGAIEDLRDAAVQLACFVRAMRTVDPSGGPPPGDHNFDRGAPLAPRDERVRAALAQLEGTIDVASAAAVWERSLGAPAWDRAPVWIHGDLHGGNLLMREGRVSAVIDFGGLGVGDPACDVMVAWTFLPAEVRNVFRSELAVDDATWDRGRGWALSMGLIAFPYYRDTNPSLAASARRWIEETIADGDR